MALIATKTCTPLTVVEGRLGARDALGDFPDMNDGLGGVDGDTLWKSRVPGER